MKRQNILLVFVLFISFCFSANAADRRSNPNQLKIMNFNVLFMWDGVAPEDGNINFEWKNNPQKAQKRMKEIADVIRKNDPDIVHLCEVENLDAITLLIDKFLPDSGYKPYLAQGIDTATGQDVAIISKVDPVHMMRYPKKGKSGSTSKSVSKNYVAKFKIGQRKIGLIGLHFLARPFADNRMNKRQAQANAIHMASMDLVNEGYEPVILGDFNDYSDKTMDYMGNKPITIVMKHIREMDPSKPDDDLFNVAERLPQNERYTSHWDRNRNNKIERESELTMIDHILVSPSLKSNLSKVYIDHSHDPTKLSDHYPVIATFTFSDDESVISEEVASAVNTNPVVGSKPGGSSTIKSTQINDGAGVNPFESLEIVATLPWPQSNEYSNEFIIIKNSGKIMINLTGCTIQNSKEHYWDLGRSGIIKPGETLAVFRSDQKHSDKNMLLKNEGDTLQIVDRFGRKCKKVTYTGSKKNQVLFFNN